MTIKKAGIDWRIVCVGLVCLTTLEIAAILSGFNGTLLKIILVIIAFAIGVKVPDFMKTK